jgi:hypothetical protein
LCYTFDVLLLYGPDGKPISLSEHRQQEHKVRKAPSRRASRGKRHWFSSIPPIWKAIFFVLGIPGIVIGILSVLPMPTVTPGELLDRSDPFSASFRVSNDGFFALHAVQFECEINIIDSRGVKILRTLGHEPIDFPIGDLASHGFTTTFCTTGIKGLDLPIFAHITIRLSFRPDFLPWRSSRTFPIQTVTGQDGLIHWIPVSR